MKMNKVCLSHLNECQALFTFPLFYTRVVGSLCKGLHFYSL